MTPEVKELRGDQIPDAWRPAWAACWVVELNGAIMAGPYVSESEARSVAEGKRVPQDFQTPLR
ncbi:hypothetical protein HKW98_05650 [Stutzerimonas urumqiensis]|uniref:hypothetical protein n=1 Tax=Stutzerimonas urumqiensis TaxID=638269 RepID=UPI003BAC907E